MVRGCNTCDEAHAATSPTPLLSCLINDCMENGQDLTAGGARYNPSGVQGVGTANLADSLEVIRQAVFEEQLLTLPQLVAMLDRDWTGEGVLSHGKVLDEADIARILQMNEAPVPHTAHSARNGGRASHTLAERPDRARGGAQGSLRDRESDIILQVLEETGGNKSETARRLGISPSTLWRKLKSVRPRA